MIDYKVDSELFELEQTGKMPRQAWVFLSALEKTFQSKLNRGAKGTTNSLRTGYAEYREKCVVNYHIEEFVKEVKPGFDWDKI